ncbi:MAG: sugar transferase [Bacteroidetes bacterium]|nr:sugar transferase [Bacteroidota bacterium]
MYNKFLKRWLDIWFSLLLIILFFPLFILVSIICIVSFKGRILFKQQRVGKDEKIFTIYKFITMRPLTNFYSKDSDRLTPAGRFLRRSSLDELPQLFNILKGDMSLIGPRPLLIKYLPYYYDHEKIRHHIRPGLTGLAQVNGRNNASWDERLSYDCKYVKNLSFTMDVSIFFKTIIQIFKAENIQADPRDQRADLDEERKQSGFITTPDK